MTTNQIEYQKHLETQRANLARETENTRHNVATEGEDRRHNIATEGETYRHNTTTEKETERFQKNKNATDYIRSISRAVSAVYPIVQDVAGGIAAAKQLSFFA